MARAFAGDPMPPGAWSGALTRNTSHTPSSAQSAARSSVHQKLAQRHFEVADQHPVEEAVTLLRSREDLDCEGVRGDGGHVGVPEVPTHLLARADSAWSTSGNRRARTLKAARGTTGRSWCARARCRRGGSRHRPPPGQLEVDAEGGARAGLVGPAIVGQGVHHVEHHAPPGDPPLRPSARWCFAVHWPRRPRWLRCRRSRARSRCARGGPTGGPWGKKLS